MSEHNVIAITFADPAKAYQALSELKGADFEGRLRMRAGAVVSRSLDGQVSVPESARGDEVVATWRGGLTGALIGVLGGPIGVLFGWTTGMLVGSAVDLSRADQRDDLLGQISAALPAGGTAVVAEVEEVATEVVDGIVAPLQGTVVRRSAAQVLAELEAAEAAYAQARDEAGDRAREQRKAERKASFDQRRDSLKEKLGVS